MLISFNQHEFGNRMSSFNTFSNTEQVNQTAQVTTWC